MKKRVHEPLIGEKLARQCPRLIGDLPQIDETDPTYKLLNTEFKPWDGTEPIFFESDGLILLYFGRRRTASLISSIRPGQEVTSAEASLHQFSQRGRIDRVQPAALVQVEHCGAYLLHVITGEIVEEYDPRVVAVGLGHVDTDATDNP